MTQDPRQTVEALAAALELVEERFPKKTPEMPRSSGDIERARSTTTRATPGQPEAPAAEPLRFAVTDHADASDHTDDPEPLVGERDGLTPSAAVAMFGDLPLREIALRVTDVIRSRGSVRDEQLASTFADHHNVNVPKQLVPLVMLFAWSAKGHRFVELDEDTWSLGEVAPHEIENFGDWTFYSVIDRAKALLPTVPESTIYEQLLHEVYSTPSGRVPRIVTRIVGKAIFQAKKQLGAS